MKTLRLLLLIATGSVLLFACEKKIDLDLNESEQQLVVEAILHDNPGDNFVKLSKTRVYNNNGVIERVSNAKVQIADDLGNTYMLNELPNVPGYYTNSSLTGITGRTYQLSITADEQFITASSFMNARAEIDSLSQEEETAFKEGDGNVKEYRVFCHFKDSGNYENFYRIKAFAGATQKDGFINLSDEYIDGRSTFYPVFDVTFEEGDTATVQLLTVDEPNFRYFTALFSSQGGEVPGNPKSNLIGEKVVGYFGAYAKSESTIIIGQ